MTASRIHEGMLTEWDGQGGQRDRWTEMGGKGSSGLETQIGKAFKDVLLDSGFEKKLRERSASRRTPQWPKMVGAST